MTLDVDAARAVGAKNHVVLLGSGLSRRRRPARPAPRDVVLRLCVEVLAWLPAHLVLPLGVHTERVPTLPAEVGMDFTATTAAERCGLRRPRRRARRGGFRLLGGVAGEVVAGPEVVLIRTRAVSGQWTRRRSCVGWPTGAAG